MTFVPQYFEIRDVGKRIKSTKKQFIWRFQLDGRDCTVELFNSVMSNKKKVMVNGQMKAEMKQKSESFMYQCSVHGKRVTIQAVNETFDLVYEGSMFQVLWDQEKRKSSFNWDNRNKKHDPFAVHDFGKNIDRVVAPTTREQGTRQGIDLQRMTREEEAKKSGAAASNMDSETASIAMKERAAAVQALKDEKNTLYNECKSALGEEEAKLQIQQFMSTTYKKRMKEINETYGDEATLAQAASKSAPKKEKKRPQASEEAKQETFETGFDHGFESMATFNGKSVGKDEGPKVSANVIEKPKQPEEPAKQPAQQQPAAGNTNFDFNFDDAPSGQPAAADMDLDDLLSGGQAKKSARAEQVNIFEFDSVQQASQPNQQQASQPQTDLNDIFGSSLPQADPQAQNNQAPKPGFIPNPMSHKQEQAHLMMAQMNQQQQMMQMMAAQHATQQQQFYTGAASMQGGNPFAMQMSGQNPFMTNPAAMGNPNNAFQTFPQQQMQPGMGQPGMQMQGQPQFPQQRQQSSNPFDNM